MSLIKLQEKLDDSHFKGSVVTIMGEEYLLDNNILSNFIESYIISLRNGDIKS